MSDGLEDKIKKKESSCPECGGRLIIDKHGELVCENCGLVVEEKIDSGPDWRAFDPEEFRKKAHAGPPHDLKLHDGGLHTKIGRDREMRDAYGRRIPLNKQPEISRLRKLQRQIIVPPKEKNLVYALTEISKYASHLNLPQPVLEQAVQIYKGAFKENLTRGRSIEDLVAASLYAACRVMNVPRSLNEIAKTTGIPYNRIGRNYKALSKALKLKLEPISVYNLINPHCSQLRLSSAVRNKVYEIITIAEKAGLTNGRRPHSVLGAAIYISGLLSGEHRTQREIAEVVGVTDITIRYRYKEMCRRLGIEIKT